MQIEKLHDFPQNPVDGGIYEIIPDKSKIVSSTNRLFNKYPTRYISAVPRFAILKYSNPGETVLDPVWHECNRSYATRPQCIIY